jgi:hypothetical protein
MKSALKTVAVLTLVLVFLAGAVGSALAGGKKLFRDEDQAPWARAYLAAASLKGLLKGDPDGRFRPNDPLRREELVAALVRFAGLEEAAESMSQAVLPFRDAARVLERAAWARGCLAAAHDAGILAEEEDEFLPGEAADRLWAAELLVRVLGLQGEAELRAGEGVGFADVKDVPPEKLGYLAVAVERGLLQGFPDGTFRPKEKLTRAQLAALLERAALHTKQLGKYEVRGAVAEVVYEEKREIAPHVDGLRKDLRRYPVSPDALVLVDAKQATLEDVEPGFRASLVLNAEGTAVVVSARSVQPVKKGLVLRGWLVDLPDLEGADMYGLVPGVRWGWVEPLLDKDFRLRVEEGPRDGVERRELGKFAGFPVVTTLVPADGGVAEQMKTLLGKFVEVRAERVKEPNIHMRPLFIVLEVRAAELPLLKPVPLPQPQPGPEPELRPQAEGGA